MTDISGELVNGAAPGTFDDGVSICSYVSRQHGIELTVEEGGRIRELLDEQDRTNG